MSCVVWLFVYDCFVFFFFKQKTAYEMRISDWSSDVCSSDLLLQPAGAGTGQGGIGDHAQFGRGIDGEGGMFELDLAVTRMAEHLDALALAEQDRKSVV